MIGRDEGTNIVCDGNWHHVASSWSAEQGQVFLDGKPRAPFELKRAALPKELEQFYLRLLSVLRKPAVRDGEWQWLSCRPAWDGNGSWDSFVAHSWRAPGGERMLIAVNYASHHSQCYVDMPFPEIADRSVRLVDSLGSACYDRDGNELRDRGLYLDLQPWSYHAFDLEFT